MFDPLLLPLHLGILFVQAILKCCARTCSCVAHPVVASQPAPPLRHEPGLKRRCRTVCVQPRTRVPLSVQRAGTKYMHAPLGSEACKAL